MRTFKRSEMTIGWPDQTLDQTEIAALSDAELASYLRACGPEYDGINGTVREAICRMLERGQPVDLNSLVSGAPNLTAGMPEPLGPMKLGTPEALSPAPTRADAARALDPEPERRTDSPRATASGLAPVNPDDAPVPDSRKRADGQAVDHWVLPPEERAKGFVRPVRRSYQHVGPPGPQYPLHDLTDEERTRYADYGYVKREDYPPERAPAVGRYWTQKDLDEVGNGCQVVTRMPQAIAETYARDPGYYGSTWCCGCRAYLPVKANGHFVWEGTDERVGT